MGPGVVIALTGAVVAVVGIQNPTTVPLGVKRPTDS